MQSDSPVLRDIVLIGGGHSHVGVLHLFAMRPLAGGCGAWQESEYCVRSLRVFAFNFHSPHPVGERWRDLLLAEYLALETLREAGIPAARTHLLDHEGQRFLEGERFDRVGEMGRRAVFSLSVLDAEFVGAAASNWPNLARRLAAEKVIVGSAAETAALLWAFGTLIGNTDMHGGNLSFLSEQGPPCEIAPAYHMSPMGFTPRSGGGRPETLAEAGIDVGAANETWRRAEDLAGAFLARIVISKDFSRRFDPCIAALERHIDTAGARIARLG